MIHLSNHYEKTRKHLNYTNLGIIDKLLHSSPAHGPTLITFSIVDPQQREPD